MWKLQGKPSWRKAGLKNKADKDQIHGLGKILNCKLKGVNYKTLKDKVSAKFLIEKSNLLSVNQINAKVKLQKMWKVLNVDNYPVKIKLNEAQVDKMVSYGEFGDIWMSEQILKRLLK